MPTIKLIISGKVQGVFYRDSARRKASELGINGYAKNLPDGTVEMIASAGRKQLDRFISWCRIGPRAAEVTGIAITEMSENTGHSSFEIRY